MDQQIQQFVKMGTSVSKSSSDKKAKLSFEKMRDNNEITQAKQI